MSWDPLAPLGEEARRQMNQYVEELRAFNRGINLISRADEPFVLERHILHSLVLTHRGFPTGARVVDWGTGGGLPAIPLAIACPQVHFTAIDSVSKKIRAVEAMIRRLGLGNVRAVVARAEEWREPADYSVSRAAAPLSTLWAWHSSVGVANRRPEPSAATWRRGLICLKGGKLETEMEALRRMCPAVEIEAIAIAPILAGSYFQDKLIVCCSLEPARID